MNAAIIERNWVVEWFDERQCYHMPSLTMAPDGTLLAVWNGGFLQWNGDPVLRIQSSSRPLHQVVKLTSVSRNFANSRMISPLRFFKKMGSWQQ